MSNEELIRDVQRRVENGRDVLVWSIIRRHTGVSRILKINIGTKIVVRSGAKPMIVNSLPNEEYVRAKMIGSVYPVGSLGDKILISEILGLGGI